MLTLREREEAAGAVLYGLVTRLVRDYREARNSCRPPFLREPRQLALVVGQLETVLGDCRELLRCKLEGGEDGLDAVAGPGMACGDGLAGGNGRSGQPARR